jgi:hypothetical protein
VFPKNRLERSGDSASSRRTRTTRKKQLAQRTLPPALADEPPVVARLVVEIRSDAHRTVARGSLEEAEVGKRTSIQVEGATPSQLLLSLVSAFFRLPAFAGSVAQALLVGRSRDRLSRREQ